jgi:hypothetical protein
MWVAHPCGRVDGGTAGCLRGAALERSAWPQLSDLDQAMGVDAQAPAHITVPMHGDVMCPHQGPRLTTVPTLTYAALEVLVRQMAPCRSGVSVVLNIAWL